MIRGKAGLAIRFKYVQKRSRLIFWVAFCMDAFKARSGKWVNLVFPTLRFSFVLQKQSSFQRLSALLKAAVSPAIDTILARITVHLFS